MLLTFICNTDDKENDVRASVMLAPTAPYMKAFQDYIFTIFMMIIIINVNNQFQRAA